jgi:hypothetical protein
MQTDLGTIDKLPATCAWDAAAPTRLAPGRPQNSEGDFE